MRTAYTFASAASSRDQGLRQESAVLIALGFGAEKLPQESKDWTKAVVRNVYTAPELTNSRGFSFMTKMYNGCLIANQ